MVLKVLQGLQGVKGAQGTQGIQKVVHKVHKVFKDYKVLTEHTGIQGLQGQKGTQGTDGTQGIQGLQGAKGAQGAQGIQGVKGTQGTDGNFGGTAFAYTFDGALTEADPGDGEVRLNGDAMLGQISATRMFIDDEDANGVDIQAYLRTLDDSTSTVKGHVTITRKGDASRFIIFSITGVTEDTGYFDLNISNVASSSASPHNNGDDVIVSFVRTGDKGTQGIQGIQGIKGAQGAQGLQGIKGTQGISKV